MLWCILRGHLPIWSGHWPASGGHPEDPRGGFAAFFQCGLGSSSDRWIQVIRECQTRWIGGGCKHEREEAGQDISRMLNFWFQTDLYAQLKVQKIGNLINTILHLQMSWEGGGVFTVVTFVGEEWAQQRWCNDGVGGIWLERLLREQGRGGAGGGRTESVTCHFSLTTILCWMSYKGRAGTGQICYIKIVLIFLFVGGWVGVGGCQTKMKHVFRRGYMTLLDKYVLWKWAVVSMSNEIGWFIPVMMNVLLEGSRNAKNVYFII